MPMHRERIFLSVHTKYFYIYFISSIMRKNTMYHPCLMPTYLPYAGIYLSFNSFTCEAVMYRVNIVAYCFCIFFSLLALFFIIPTQTPPYPGFGVPASYMPNVMCGVILMLALLGLLDTVRKKTGQEKTFELTWKMFLHFLLFMVPIIFSIPLMAYLGYVPGAFITIVALQLCAGERRVLFIISVASITAIITYILLWYGLHVPMPSL